MASFDIYRGKNIYGLGRFSPKEIEPGEYVLDEVIQNSIRRVAPISYHPDFTQLGEKCTERWNTGIQDYQNTYLAFEMVTPNSRKYHQAVWVCLGDTFVGQRLSGGIRIDAGLIPRPKR